MEMFRVRDISQLCHIHVPVVDSILESANVVGLYFCWEVIPLR